MNLLPLVARELQVASRRPSTRWLRSGASIGGMLVVVWGMLVWSGSGGVLAPIFFQGLSLSGIVAAVLISIFVTSDSLSRERRDGTLGFLFLTDLHARDVVAGKFASAVLIPGYTLIALVPALALCANLGGITAGQILRTSIALVVSLAWSIAAALFVSAHCSRQRVAQLCTAGFLSVANPLLLGLFATGGTRIAGPLFWTLTLGFLAATTTALCLTARRLGTAWRDPEQIEIGQQRERSPAPRQTARDAQPVTWLMARRLNRRAGLLSTSSAAMIGFALISGWGSFMDRLLFVLVLASAAYQVLSLVRATHAYHEYRFDGSLELLAGTRLETEELFSGLDRALFNHARPALCFLAAASLVSAAAFLVQGANIKAGFLLAVAATLWINVMAFSWVGVFWSLMTNHPFAAMLSTLVRVPLVPLLLSGVFLLAPRPDLQKVLGFWVGSSAFIAMFFSLDARSALRKHGRELLLRPFSEKPPHIENEWSFINWEEEMTRPGLQTM